MNRLLVGGLVWRARRDLMSNPQDRRTTNQDLVPREFKAGWWRGLSGTATQGPMSENLTVAVEQSEMRNGRAVEDFEQDGARDAEVAPTPRQQLDGLPLVARSIKFLTAHAIRIRLGHQKPDEHFRGIISGGPRGDARRKCGAEWSVKVLASGAISWLQGGVGATGFAGQVGDLGHGKKIRGEK